jgi:hypothetical protein
MKKMLVAVVAVVVLLSVLPISASAHPPTPVEGPENIWTYLPYFKVKNDAGECVKPEDDDDRPLCMRVAGGNTFVETYEDGWWAGDFVGISEDHGKVTIHRSGRWNFKAIVYFVGEVDGKSGTLEMSVVGGRPDALAEWQGKWVILSGTDELETLRGRGTWWGPGWLEDPNVPGIIRYDGQVHFAP